MRAFRVFCAFYCFTVSSYGQGWFVQQSGVSNRLSRVAFANTRVGYVAGFGGVVLKTTNAGATWNTLASGISNDLYSLTLTDSLTVWACGAGGAIIRTANGGATWSPLNSTTTQTLRDISAIVRFGIIVLQSCGDNGTSIVSTNSGASWFANTTNTTARLNAVLLDSLQYSSAVVAGSEGTLRYSTGGPFGPWPYPGSDELTGMKGRIAPPGTLYLCSVNGTFTKGVPSWTWTTVNTGAPGGLNAIDVLGNKIWVVGDNGAVRHSTNEGANWNPQIVSSTASLRSICMIDSATGWIVGDGGLIVATRTGGVTEVHPQPSLPIAFALEQNYPNPFNPTTRITFQIPNIKSHSSADLEFGNSNLDIVTLKVYDVLGREVATLVSENLAAGSYETTFDATGLASGTYLYRLQAGDYVATKKLLLLR